MVCGSTAVALRTASVSEEAGEVATRWLDSLDEEARAEAVQPFAAASRVGWHYIPMDDRKGIPMSEMTDEQRQLVRQLGNILLSQTGHDKVQQVMQLESLVAELEGDGRRWARDPQLYYLTLFGDPAKFGSDTASRWGISFEGHHVSLNFTMEGSRVIDSTPQFLGTHPAEVKRDPTGHFEVGTRVLGPEEQLGFDLLASLDEAQRAKAVISDEAPKEVFGAATPAPLAEPAAGLPASEMTDAQQQTLRKLITLYAEIVADPLAQRRLQDAESNLSATHFAWAGGDRPGVPHYYRIEGPTLEIELVNSAPDADGNPANHLHAMYRDNRGDFGLDVPAAGNAGSGN